MTVARCASAAADQRTGARNGMFGHRCQPLYRSTEHARRRDVAGSNRVAGEPLGDALAIIGIETPVGVAGEVEIALGLVLGHIDRAAAPPQRRVGQAVRRHSPGIVPVHLPYFPLRFVLRRPNRQYPRNL